MGKKYLNCKPPSGFIKQINNQSEIYNNISGRKKRRKNFIKDCSVNLNCVSFIFKKEFECLLTFINFIKKQYSKDFQIKINNLEYLNLYYPNGRIIEELINEYEKAQDGGYLSNIIITNKFIPFYYLKAKIKIDFNTINITLEKNKNQDTHLYTIYVENNTKYNPVLKILKNQLKETIKKIEYIEKRRKKGRRK